MIPSAASPRRAYLALTAPALILMGALFVVPLAQVLWLSVSEPRLGFGNYAEFVTNPVLPKIWLTTLRVSLVTTLVSVVLGYVVALVNKKENEQLVRDFAS